MENRNKRAILVFIMVWVMSIVVSMCQYKVPPVMAYLIQDLGLSKTMAGLTMSIFSITGVLIALPAAGLLSKLGPKISGIVIFMCVVVGSVIGATTNSGVILLVGRTIEGISAGLVAVVTPAVIGMWYSPNKRALPMALFSCYVPIGMMLMFNASAPIVALFGGWASTWWFTAILCAIVAVPYALIVDVPTGVKEEMNSSEAKQKESILKVVFTPSIWILGGVVFLFGINSLSYYSWGATYLQEVLGYSTAVANFQTSVQGIGGIIGGILIGIILRNKMMDAKKWVLVVFAVIYTVTIFFCFRLTPATSLIYMSILGVLNGVIGAVVAILSPDTVKNPRHVGIAMAVILGISLNCGSLVGIPIISALIEKYSWSGVSIPMTIISVVMVAVALMVKGNAKTDRSAV
jgi:predicted MFS family arabinose efflux permease